MSRAQTDSAAPAWLATRGAIDFHGLRVAWTTHDLPSDPVARLLAAFPSAADDTSPSRAPDLEVSVVAGDASERAARLRGFRPAFFQGNVRVLEKGGALHVLAPAARVAVAADGKRIDAVVDPARLVERGFVGTTLVVAMALALRHAGLFHLHGGAIVCRQGAAERRVLVLGDSGSGKSTVTLSLLDAASRHLGDDTLFLARRDGRPCLLAFPRPFHLRPATARAFPALAARAVAREKDGDAKVHVHAVDLPGRPVLCMGAPHLVLFPEVTAEPTSRAERLTLAEAFGLALGSCALVAVDGLAHKAEQLALLRELLTGSDARALRLGADWLEAPARTATRVLEARPATPEGGER